MDLYQAARAGKVVTLRRLLKAGADVNGSARGRDSVLGYAVGSGTPLMAAAEGGHTEACRLLRDAGARVNVHNANGSTPLMHAAAPGHLAVVRLLLDAGANVDATDRDRRTALLVAAWAGHAEVVGALLAAGADPNHKGKANGTSVLHWAAWQRHHEVVRRLLKSGADINIRDSFDATPLMMAVEYADVAMVRLLLQAGADVNAQNQAGYTALMYATYPGKIARARLLLRHGADVNLGTSNFGETPLMSAAGEGDMRLARLFLQAGADVHRKDRDGETALYRAVQGEHLGVARLLLEAGADVNVKTKEGQTSLGLAAEKGNVRLFELLQGAGARDEQRGQARGLQEERLRQAATQGDLAGVRALVRAGVDVNARKRYESPALWHAAEQGHLKLVQELLRAGARADLKGEYGSTPLLKAAEGGHRDVVRALIAAGADVNADYDRCMPESYAGWTALLAAAEGGHRDMVRDLLAAGADPDAHTVLDYTPLMLAVLGRHRDVAGLLREAGAQVDDTATHFLKVLDMAAAARRPDFRKAAGQLGKACGVKPQWHRNLPDGALYNVARGTRAARMMPQVVDELVADCLAQGEVEDEHEARKAAKQWAGDHVADRVIAAVLDEVQEALLRQGYYVTEARLGIGCDRLALLPTDDKYAVLACLGPGAGGIPFHVRWLKELEREQPFELAGAGYDTLKIRFTAPVRDGERLARRVLHLGPKGGWRPDEVGVSVGGKLTQTGSARELTAALRRGRPTLRLWWD
jgi:ankyrin repeat protein